MAISSRIPFIVGVTGHRDCDPACHVEMRSALVRLLDGIASEMPSTPILLISGLAAGSDQLAAQWALEWGAAQEALADGAPRLSLVAALPLAVDDYSRDFSGDCEAGSRFSSLLSSCAYRITLDRGGEFVADRDAAYVRLGSFIAEQSQMLVAFWDGARTLKRGGTYHVIQKCLRTDPDAAPLDLEFHRRRHLLVAPTEVDVRVIPVRRLSTGMAAAIQSAHGLVVPDLAAAKHADYRMRLERMNCVLFAGVSGPVSDEPRTALMARFEAVDSLATRMKRAFLRHVTAISVMSVLAILCFQIFNFMSSVGWAALYLVLTGSLMAWFLVLRHFSSIEWVFVFARSLAEAMRVQVAWNSSGLVDRVSDQYMSRRSLDLSALRQLVAASTLETLADGLRPVDGAVSASPAAAWIDGQRQYMSARISGQPAKPLLARLTLSLLRLLVRYYWALVLLVVIILVVKSWQGAAGTDGAPGVSDAERWLPMGFLLIGTVLFLKTGLEYHDSAVLQREDIDRFRRMLPVYERASAMVAAAPSDGDRRRILSALGKEAIDENAEWFVRHTDALKLPTVG